MAYKFPLPPQGVWFSSQPLDVSGISSGMFPDDFVKWAVSSGYFLQNQLIQPLSGSQYNINLEYLYASFTGDTATMQQIQGLPSPVTVTPVSSQPHIVATDPSPLPPTPAPTDTTILGMSPTMLLLIAGVAMWWMFK